MPHDQTPSPQGDRQAPRVFFEAHLSGGLLGSAALPEAVVQATCEALTLALNAVCAWKEGRSPQGQACGESTLLALEARPGNFALRFALTMPQRARGATVGPLEVLDSFFDLAQAASTSPEALLASVPQAEDGQAFLLRFRDLCPDARWAHLLELTTADLTPKRRSVRLDMFTRSSLTKALKQAKAAPFRVLRGVLRNVRLTGLSPTVGLMQAGEERPTTIQIPAGRFDHLLGPWLNHRVLVRCGPAPHDAAVKGLWAHSIEVEGLPFDGLPTSLLEGPSPAA